MKRLMSVILVVCLLLVPVMASAATLEVNGGYYTGIVKNNKMNGYGMFIDKVGDKYIGTFKDNVLTGKGTAIIAGEKFEGNFVKGKLDGKVNIYLRDGRVIKNEPMKNNVMVNKTFKGTSDNTAINEYNYIVKNSHTLGTFDAIDNAIDYLLSLNSQYYLAHILKANLYMLMFNDYSNEPGEEYTAIHSLEVIMSSAEAAMRLNPDKPEGYFYKGAAYYHLGNEYLAEAYLNASIELMDAKEKNVLSKIDPYLYLDYINGTNTSNEVVDEILGYLFDIYGMGREDNNGLGNFDSEEEKRAYEEYMSESW